MKEYRKYKVGDINVKIASNGYPCGLMLKRRLTLRECKHILKKLLAIEINTRDCFYDKEEYDDYNQEIEYTVNEWLNGNLEDESIAEFAEDCSDEQLGVFNMFPIVMYLLKIHAI